MTDGQKSFGQVPYEPARCRCGDLVTLHVINGKGQRARCSDPLCTCARFVAAEGAEVDPC